MLNNIAFMICFCYMLHFNDLFSLFSTFLKIDTMLSRCCSTYIQHLILSYPGNLSLTGTAYIRCCRSETAVHLITSNLGRLWKIRTIQEITYILSARVRYERGASPSGVVKSNRRTRKKIWTHIFKYIFSKNWKMYFNTTI